MRTHAALALRAACAAGLVLLAAGCGSGAAGRPLAVPPPARLPASARSHVVVVVMENQEAGDLLGSPDSPYVRRLVRRYGLATRSFAIRHPSLPDYLALTSGSTQGIVDDCTDCHVQAPNLVDRLEAAHRSWRAYMEDLPRPCSPVAFAGGYAKKHNPFMYYDDVARDPARCNRIVTFDRLAADLRRGRLPDFAWITPSLRHDTHDCPVAVGDRFLAGLVPRLLRELGPRGVLILTWDEGTTDRGCCGGARGGQIATIAAGPGVRRGGRLRVPVDHYGTLRTIDGALRLRPLGASADPRHGSLAGLFRRRPRVP